MNRKISIALAAAALLLGVGLSQARECKGVHIEKGSWGICIGKSTSGK